MNYNVISWFLFEKNKLKRLLKTGSLSELKTFLENIDDKTHSYIDKSLEKELKKNGLYRNHISNYIDDKGLFNGNKEILVSPIIQEFFEKRGVNWEDSFTAEELNIAQAFRKALFGLKNSDIDILSSDVSLLISDGILKITDIIDENNNISEKVIDAVFAYNYMSIFNFVRNYSFSSSFIRKIYGKEQD